MIVDTDVLVDLSRGLPEARTWLISLSELPSVTGISVGELISGCPNAAELKRTRVMLAPFPVIWASEDDGRHAVELIAAYKLSHGLGLLDALSAATARRYNLPLATFNVKHFRAVPGLTITQPYERP